MIQGRSLSNTLIGTTNGISSKDYAFTGLRFGSVQGLTGGQYTREGVTFLGGIAYGTQGAKNVEQDAAATVAMGLRYVFLRDGQIKPYAEAGGWVTPAETLTFRRPYLNGASTTEGTGDTSAYEWAVYGKLGVAYNFSERDQVNAWTDIARQAMHFDGYSETSISTNPFPATIKDGYSRLYVVRGGLGYNHGFTERLRMGLSAAVAHSFSPKTNLNLVVPGVGEMTPTAKSNTWGEFGYLVEIGLTDRLSFNLSGDITAGGRDVGVTPHGGGGFSYKF